MLRHFVIGMKNAAQLHPEELRWQPTCFVIVCLIER